MSTNIISQTSAASKSTACGVGCGHGECIAARHLTNRELAQLETLQLRVRVGEIQRAMCFAPRERWARYPWLPDLRRWKNELLRIRSVLDQREPSDERNAAGSAISCALGWAYHSGVDLQPAAVPAGGAG